MKSVKNFNVPRKNTKRSLEPNRKPKARRAEKLQTRLSPSARRSLILQGAIEYFAEVGFTGKTRELSERLGITQPLLYRYFPSKEVLMEEVFEIVFLDSWRPGWDRLLSNQGIPLQERLIEFYQEYFEDSFSRRWHRIESKISQNDSTTLNRPRMSLSEKPICGKKELGGNFR
jgi:AcrR family transcriptional regulator